ncbi:hypothetical protein GCM10010503_38490 [Streptomyces lucensis JCM 4490]|uniref:Uncharacterized protein n=1 Tax=Streptomyces lucensis JCM 4490 TaxID=1306176 RepID=A0A918J7U7_9ACTN|nr:hypothetical protein GCM10010503_38490 [Streptomyces lucensis JCM 4490]
MRDHKSAVAHRDELAAPAEPGRCGDGVDVESYWYEQDGTEGRYGVAYQHQGEAEAAHGGGQQR